MAAPTAPSRRRRTILLACLLAVGATIGTVLAVANPADPFRVAASFTSRTVCAAAFVSRLDPDQVYAETMASIPLSGLLTWALSYRVERSRMEVVTTVIGGFKARYVYRDGLGCTMLADREPASPVDRTLSADRTMGPALEAIAGPALVDPDDERLRAALDAAFAEPETVPVRRTKAIVIVHDGRVIAERYAPGIGIDTPLPGFSTTKSIVNALIGILVRQGRLAVDEPPPFKAWQDSGSGYRAVTVDHLLRMTSGLALGATRWAERPPTS
jgi:hypothetical protein